MRIHDLLKKYGKQAQTGAVLISEEDAPGISKLASLFSQTPVDGMLVQSARLSFSRNPRRLYALAPKALEHRTKNPKILLRRLAQELHSSGHSVSLQQVGNETGLEVDREFYPLIDLIKLNHLYSREAIASIRTATTREMRLKRAVFYRKEPLALLVEGRLPSGESVQALFTAKRDRISVVPVLRSKEDLVMYSVYHPELADVDLDRPLFVLSSVEYRGSSTTAPLPKGLSFLTAYQLGPYLRQAVSHTMPLTLGGGWSMTPKRSVFRLESAPFTFHFGPVTIEPVMLLVHGNWNEKAAIKEYECWFRGAWKAGPLVIPVWTDLPPDDGVMCWNTVGSEKWLDLEESHATLGSGGFEMPLESPASASPLMAGWNGWFDTWPRLANILRHAAPLHLVHVQLGVDCVSRQPSDVAMTIVGSNLKINGLPTFQTTRIYFKWSVGNPWNESQRSILAEVHVHFVFLYYPFIGCMTPPQFLLRAKSLHPVSYRAASQLLLEKKVEVDFEVTLILRLDLFAAVYDIVAEDEKGNRQLMLKHDPNSILPD